MASQRNGKVPGTCLNSSLSSIKSESTSGADRGEILRKNRTRGVGKKEYDNKFLEIIVIIMPIPRNNYNNPAYLDKLCNK